MAVASPSRRGGGLYEVFHSHYVKDCVVPKKDPFTVSCDSQSFLINGKRTLLAMGEIHYARSPRSLWPILLDRAQACGLNSIASYVFWNWHEPLRDQYDFSGDHDLGQFLKLCAERSLYVLLRMGPYCCAEWNYGGYPSWLRDEPGITIRTHNHAYLSRVEKYFEHLCAEVRPYLATNGGPIILAQVENEYGNVAKRYGADGERYLVWMADLARKLGIDVPVIMCEGAAPDVVETVNGFSISDDRVATFRKRHPDLPMIWTELWTAWYDTWGYQTHKRSAPNIAWHLLQFIGNGGAGWNCYPMHGGTNFGRTSMYLQTTSYDFDAPLDEYGRITPKGEYLARLHKVLVAHQELLLAGTRTREKQPDGSTRIRWTLGDLSLTIEHDATGAGRIIDQSGQILFDVAADGLAVEQSHAERPWQPLVTPKHWIARPEPGPQERTDGIVSEQPIEGLSLTHDQSDYCWYSATVKFSLDGAQTFEFDGCGDLLHLYLDGILVAQTQPPFLEIRGQTAPRQDGIAPANDLEQVGIHGFRQCFTFSGLSGKHRLDILSVALGLVKADWCISASMETERKGVWDTVRVNKKPIAGWTMQPCLVGETLGYAQKPWDRGVPGASAVPCTWYRSDFPIAPEIITSDADFRIDAAGLGKGMLFVNGHAIGRHWLIPGTGYGADEGWHHQEEDGLSLGPVGEPTQRYYHVPQSWLAESNTLVIFEEQACKPDSVRMEIRRNS